MVSINFEGAKQFYAKQPDKTAAQAAFDTLVNGTGAGNDFIGWVDLPVNYDKEEFARIQKAAKKIQSDSRHLSSSVSAAAILVHALWLNC